jgi:PTH1 family peptidyl-tRNA hydrolase
MGFLVIDEIAVEYGISMQRKKFEADMGEGAIAGTPVMLVKPRTFMNRSGVSVGQIASYFKYNSEDLIVVHDDLDISFHSVRIKQGGGHGGHKGLISIISALGSQEFLRVRMGIGKPIHKGMVENYVLTPFNGEEILDIHDILSKGGEAVAEILKSGVQAAMCRFNIRRTKNHGEEEESPSSL